MANNKIELADGTVLMDITDTTAVASDVAADKYFYTAAGVKTLGTNPGGQDGKSAYEAAQEGGYPGTEAQFNADLAAVSDMRAALTIGVPTPIPITWTAGKAWDRRDSASEPRDSTGRFASQLISASPGDEFIITHLRVNTGNYQRAYLVLDSSYAAVQYPDVPAEDSYQNYNVIIGNDGAYLVINCGSSTQSVADSAVLNKITESFADVSDIVDTVAENTEDIEVIKALVNDATLQDISALRATTIHSSKAQFVPPLLLLHFSDLHNTAEEIPYILSIFDGNPKISDIICTGDIMGSYYNVNTVTKYFAAFDEDHYALLVLGNHDYYDDDSQTTTMTQAQAYGYYFAPNIADWGVTYTTDKTYWYKDYVDEGVRLIGLDTLLDSSDMAVQVTWLAGVLADALTNDLAVVIAHHCPPRSTGVKIESSFSDNITFPSTGSGMDIDINGVGLLGAVDTFIEYGGEFVCHLAGHVHHDMLMYSSLYPDQTVVMVAPASYKDGPNSIITGGVERDVGTKFQHLFNIVMIDRTDKLFKILRVGADRDMYMRPRTALCFDYDNRRVVWDDQTAYLPVYDGGVS